MRSPRGGKISLRDIVADLRVVLREGIGMLDEETRLPTLMCLPIVQHEATSDDRMELVAAAERVVTRAIDLLEGSPYYEVAIIVFAADKKWRGLLAKERRSKAADRLRHKTETFRTQDEGRILRLLARQVYRLNSELLARTERLGLPRPHAAVRADWKVRFERYRRMRRHVHRLRDHLVAVMETNNDGSAQYDRDNYLASSLWHYAHFLVELDDLFVTMADVWMMPDPEKDFLLSRLIDDLRFKNPFNERGRSWLRVTLREVPKKELDPFAWRLFDAPFDVEVVGRWDAWLASCACEDVEVPECGAHQMVNACRELDDLIEDQWMIVRPLLSPRAPD